MRFDSDKFRAAPCNCPPRKRSGMPETGLNKFLNEVEKSLRQARAAINPVDKRAWVSLAEDWMKLARAAKERDL
jgi:hypothetical protein